MLTMAVLSAWLLGGPNVAMLNTIAAAARRFERLPQPTPLVAQGSGVAAEVMDVAGAMERLQEFHLERMKLQTQHVGELESVIESMAEGVLVTGPQGIIERSNRAAERLLGVPLRPGTPLIAVVRDYEVHALMERAHVGGVQRAELDGPGGHGTLGCAALPVLGPTPGRVLLVIHDLTETRRVERTRREFVANVSHELRTPLTTIKASVDTLLEGALTDPQAAPVFLRRIDGEVDRMALLVSDLLELSRLESGQVTPRLAAVPVRPLVDETLDRLRGRAAQLHLALTNSVPAGISVPADPDMLRQVFTNLLDNAVKYSTEAGSVTVSAEVVGRYLRIAVADTGQGIPPQHLPHVFERFYKVERARREGGTGLGLAIVKHIVQAHGGEVAVESTEGAGSTFRFTVPLAPAPSEATEGRG